ncbi:hypothetical protein MCOR02_003093 [Pyricularia oryzae]|uniref:Mannan endo-1,6-alpha-mannosidase n=1 Tax=Pyricularia oryzae TaxID=318829 RepID=A0A4P7N3X6_PYROR|nr:hypothetical protein MCOR02_003093 [Pyricularia oryzae]KAI6292851.1 hypothetical protein MCOR34_009972 [Pyricularia oryzae]KAI6452968.1 hypothetical protein MCOR15_008800 [Pyricularia oryzae]KAI6458845.1 hypothetical protein MCOR17_007209 [Pyricularia oryzae]KAI6480567.1 hypothetical protein MCOR13_011090 [Pyricularia oryzae]
MVQFMKSVRVAAMAISAVPKDMKISESASVQAVVKTIAADTMSYYKGSATNYVDLEAPYWWWQSGALFGAMSDYSHYTGDKSYDQTIATALLAQTGPKYDFMSPAHEGQMGNDDLGFWGFAVMSAAERNLPQPESSVPSWLKMSENIHASLASRWDTTTCGGGLLWQIFASNPNGLNYKNSVSNGAFFQLSARLARATGNQTYMDWANKIFDWSTGVGFVDQNFHVVDGADKRDDCKKVNPVSFTYTNGIYMYGAALLANMTSDRKWIDRTQKFVEASKAYFGPTATTPDILYEPACESGGTCNVDMKSHKGQLARFMWASTLMQPAIRPAVETLLLPSAQAAASTCTGGANGSQCSHRWWTGAFDNDTGLGQEMCALETIQGILAGSAAPPLRGNDIKDVRVPKQGASAPAPKRLVREERRLAARRA